MSKNPKLTIALAFVFTFLIGVGAGYLLRGGIQPTTVNEDMIRRDAMPGSSQMDENGMRDQGGQPPDQTTTDRGERYRDEDRRGESRQDGKYDDRDDDDDDDRPAWDHRRLKKRLARDLELSDETTDELFSILEHHRELGKEAFIEHKESFHEKVEQLQLELEEDLSEILTEEQMEVWRKKYALEKGRLSREQRRQKER